MGVGGRRTGGSPGGNLSLGPLPPPLMCRAEGSRSQWEGRRVGGVAQWVYIVYLRRVYSGWGVPRSHPAPCATAGAVELGNLGSNTRSASHRYVIQGT